MVSSMMMVAALEYCFDPNPHPQTQVYALLKSNQHVINNRDDGIHYYSLS